MLHSCPNTDQTIVRLPEGVYALCSGSPGEGQGILTVGLEGVYGQSCMSKACSMHSPSVGAEESGGGLVQ